MIVEIQNLELKFKVKSKDPIVISLQNSTKNQSSCLILFSELKPTWFLKGNLGMVLIDIKNISKINQEDWIPQSMDSFTGYSLFYDSQTLLVDCSQGTVSRVFLQTKTTVRGSFYDSCFPFVEIRLFVHFWYLHYDQLLTAHRYFYGSQILLRFVLFTRAIQDIFSTINIFLRSKSTTRECIYNPYRALVNFSLFLSISKLLSTIGIMV